MQEYTVSYGVAETTIKARTSEAAHKKAVKWSKVIDRELVKLGLSPRHKIGCELIMQRA